MKIKYIQYNKGNIINEYNQEIKNALDELRQKYENKIIEERYNNTVDDILLYKKCMSSFFKCEIKLTHLHLHRYNQKSFLDYANTYFSSYKNSVYIFNQRYTTNLLKYQNIDIMHEILKNDITKIVGNDMINAQTNTRFIMSYSVSGEEFEIFFEDKDDAMMFKLSKENFINDYVNRKETV